MTERERASVRVREGEKESARSCCVRECVCACVRECARACVRSCLRVGGDEWGGGVQYTVYNLLMDVPPRV